MAKPSPECLEYDVIVVGAGGAGLRTAIEASAQGARTAIVCKGLLGKALTVMAQGGIAAALGNVDAHDSWQSHFRDTVRSGRFVGDWRAAQMLAQEAAERVLELERWGALFDRTADGRVAQRHLGGHLFARLAHRADRTGLEMLRTLQQQAIHRGIEVHMECDIRRLLLDEGRIAGALGYWRDSGEFVLFKCKAVVLATGGGGQAWKFTTNTRESTGDGMALALDAGAQLTDMEFVQFHPTGMVWPPSARGLLVSETARSLGGTLRNAAGRRFMMDHIPEHLQQDTADSEAEADAWRRDPRGNRFPPELLPPDEVSRAIDAEVRAGRGTPHGGVWLDVASRASAKEIRQQMPSACRHIRNLCGIDITKAPLEVGPSCHYSNGGVRVDPASCASSVPGLFAVGEVAAGLHGAGRLSGNALSESLVFGRRAGLSAAQYCQTLRFAPSIDAAKVNSYERTVLGPFASNGTENPHVNLEELQNCMHRLVGVVRTEQGLTRALETIRVLRQRSTGVSVGGGRRYNPGWHLALDLQSLLYFSEATALAALERRESRGCHARGDFPAADSGYGTLSIVVRKDRDELAISRAPVREMPMHMKRLVNWSKQWLTKRPESGSGVEMQAVAHSRTTGSP